MTTILLDGDIYLHRACAAVSTKVQFGDELHWAIKPAEAERWLRQELRALRKRLGADRVIIALGDRKANFRKELSSGYKAARRWTPKPPGFAELEALVRENGEVVWEPRLEGDDMLGLLATRIGSEQSRVVVSIDKDLLQIPGRHYNPDRDEAVNVTPEESARFHLVQTLTGDRTDNYPGCPGIGAVRANRLLDEGGATWATVDAAFARAGLTAEDALLQARLAFVLRQGFYDRKTKEIRLWTP